jgi:hypothetical protein
MEERCGRKTIQIWLGGYTTNLFGQGDRAATPGLL